MRAHLAPYYEKRSAAFSSPLSSSPCIARAAQQTCKYASTKFLNRRFSTSSPPRRRRVLIMTETPPYPEDIDIPQPSSEVAAQAQQPDHADDDDIPIPNALQVSGEPRCIQCAGKGEIHCPVCSGTGCFTIALMDTVSSSQCRMCRGQRMIPCPTCKRIVYESVLWWDKIPTEEEDSEEKWRDGPSGPRFKWGDNPSA